MPLGHRKQQWGLPGERNLEIQWEGLLNCKTKSKQCILGGHIHFHGSLKTSMWAYDSQVRVMEADDFHPRFQSWDFRLFFLLNWSLVSGCPVSTSNSNHPKWKSTSSSPQAPSSFISFNCITFPQVIQTRPWTTIISCFFSLSLSNLSLGPVDLSTFSLLQHNYHIFSLDLHHFLWVMTSSSKSSVLHESNFYDGVIVMFLKFITDYVSPLLKICLHCFRINFSLLSMAYQHYLKHHFLRAASPISSIG